MTDLFVVYTGGAPWPGIEAIGIRHRAVIQYDEPISTWADILAIEKAIEQATAPCIPDVWLESWRRMEAPAKGE